MSKYKLLKIYQHSKRCQVQLVERESDHVKFICKKMPIRYYTGNETLVAQRLGQHDNIAQLDTIEYSNHFAKVYLDYVPGCELYYKLPPNNNEGLPIVDVRYYFRQLLDTMKYAHDHGVVHRDLKLENIIVNENSSQIVIIDWNFADIWHPGTKLNFFCGSPEYAAPELLDGEPYTGPEVDIYAMGVILFAMVTGVLPNTLEKSSDGSRYHITNPSVVFPKNMDSDMVELLLGMLERDRTRRYQRIDDMFYSNWVKSCYSLIIS